MAPLELHPATEADALRAAEIESLAYGPSPFNSFLFPGPFPPNMREIRAQGFIKDLKEGETTRWIKVVDPDREGDDRTIAFAVWHVFKETPALKPSRFGPGCNVPACEALFGWLQEERKRITGARPYMYLQLLQTDPKHKGRGAGSMLTKWGLDEAQNLGMLAFLESSEEAHGLYLRMGFKDVEQHDLDMSKWGLEKTHRTWAMTREPLAD